MKHIFAHTGPLSSYRFIDAERGHNPVRQLCQVLGVLASGYYAWHQGWLRAMRKETPAWETALVKACGVHQRRYGTPAGCKWRCARTGPPWAGSTCAWPCAAGVCALQTKAFTLRTTDSTYGLRYAPNRLLDQPKLTRANQVWVSDSTYLPLVTCSWAYWRAFQDAGTTHVVGWHGGHDARRISHDGLATGFFRPAAQPPSPDFLVYSDRGGQCSGNACRALLHQHGAVRSQSRRGECDDNALPGTTQAESCWSRLKTEVLELREWAIFADLAGVQASIAEYVDYCNHDRLHSSIGYQTPYLTHRQILKTATINCSA